MLSLIQVNEIGKENIQKNHLTAVCKIGGNNFFLKYPSSNYNTSLRLRHVLIHETKKQTLAEQTGKGEEY
jgi:hypothetical protein